MQFFYNVLVHLEAHKAKACEGRAENGFSRGEQAELPKDETSVGSAFLFGGRKR